MPRTGAYIMRSGSFEATITASEGNITFGHSGSVKFIDAVSGSVAELTSSLSASVMQTEFVLGKRTTADPFWVFKPDGRMQYSKGGTNKVSEIDLAEKLKFVSRSSHDSAAKFEHMEVTERKHADKKTLIEADKNTFGKGIVVSGSHPFISLFDTDDGAMTQVSANRYFYVSSSYPWNVGHTLNATAGAAGSHWGVQAGIGLSQPPTEFHINRDGDGWFKGTISGSELNIGSSQVTTNDVTANRDLNVGRNINLDSAIVHTGDIDTGMSFGTDTLTLSAGGADMITLTEGLADKIKFTGCEYQDVITFTDGDATPSVAHGNVFKTGNTGATSITGLDGGTAGQIVTIIVYDNNTDFTDGTNFNLFRSLDWTTAVKNDVLVMVCIDGTKWTSINRMDNS